ncbi:MAG: hypothetical protein GXP40_00390 [Chloroflexi bacterium]|nr:hypothetical protein [Chloroflexota bacterium]
MKKILQSTIVKIMMTIVLLFWPGIPVWSAPVIPDPVYRLDWISLVQAPLTLMGYGYRWEWYSIIGLLVMITLIVFVWRGVKRRAK